VADDKDGKGGRQLEVDKSKVITDQGSGTGSRHALVVGVASYDNQSFGDLKYTENDAEGLAEALSKTEAGFRVRILTGTRGKDNKADAPTAANINKALDDLLAKRKKGDVVLIALAGHGVTLELKDPKGEGEPRSYPYFCASDADLTDPRYTTGQSDTMINLDDLFTRLGRCGAGTKLVLMDACRNQVTVKAGRRSLDAGSVTIPIGVAALYSSSRNQVAYETAKLGKGHGVFFYHTIEALQGKAKNDEGVVTWASLGDHVTRQVSRQVPTLIGDGAKQHPAAMGSLEGESPVLVAKAAPSDKDRKTDKDAVVIAPDKDKDKDKDKEKDRGKAEVKKEEIKNSIDMRLVLIRPGKFQMGSPDDEADREGNEFQHEVQITKPFYMGVFEVTQGQWVTVMGKNSNNSGFSLEGQFGGLVKGKDTEHFPVENLTWDQAVEFCKKLSALRAEKEAGRVYRLPTEAEWEYACRAGTKTPYHFGDKITPKLANMGASASLEGSLGRTCEVGKYTPNAWGLYDMHGNVAEWCSDWYDLRYYRTGPKKDPPGPEESGTERITRGGAGDSSADTCRSAYRGKYGPAGATIYIGMRVVCEVRKK
jgi:formylglycine-generating enzyme required for sulfatase activity